MINSRNSTPFIIFPGVPRDTLVIHSCRVISVGRVNVTAIWTYGRRERVTPRLASASSVLVTLQGGTVNTARITSMGMPAGQSDLVCVCVCVCVCVFFIIYWPINLH